MKSTSGNDEDAAEHALLLPPEKEGFPRGEDRGDLNEPRKPETAEDGDRREQEQRHPGREAHTAWPSPSSSGISSAAAR